MANGGTGYDLCIVGAGIAGLNALFVASRRLGPDARVALVDRRTEVGGMWVDTYEYVRLHQPYQLFTAGNIPWELDQPREYLATRPEVQAHLRHCADVLAGQLHVDELLGWEVVEIDEGADGVRLRCRSGEDERVLKAPRVVVATGLDIEHNPPLELSSDAVVSLSPDGTDVRGPIGDGRAPVWVVGSGKTAMDTAHALVRHHPDREVGILTGSGTLFLEREVTFATGARRLLAPRVGAMFARMADAFDGTNEDEVRRLFLERWGTSVLEEPRKFAFGILSASERDDILDGADHVVVDHLVDAVDGDDGPELVLRSGRRMAVPPGTAVLNCTGYLGPRDEQQPPLLSAGGRVMTIGQQSNTFGFPGIASFMLTHLFLIERLAEAPLYTMDVHAVRRVADEVFPWAMCALVQHNLSVMLDELSIRELSELGLDFDLWLPAVRRVPGQAAFAARHRRLRAGYRRTLDTVAARFDVHCGPLVVAAA